MVYDYLRTPRKENIKINLFYSENLENSGGKRNLALLSQSRAKFIESGKESLLPPQQNKFVFATLLRR